MTKYTKQRIKDIRKGIQVGELITDEQEDLVKHLGIIIPTLTSRTLGGMTSEKRVRYVQDRINLLLRSMSRKKK